MSEQDRLAQAVELVKTGNYADAQKIVTEVIQANKDNARAWILMAKIVDDPEKALYCWQEVARLKPDDPRTQEEITKLKGEPAPQAQPPVPPLSAKRFQSPSTQPIQPPSVSTIQSLSTEPVQPIAPAELNKKIPLPLLIGGGIVIFAVVCCVALVVVVMNTPSDPNYPITATAKAATTIAEENSPTDTPIPATATTAEQNRPTTISTSAIATIASTATLQQNQTNTPKPTNTLVPTNTPKPTNTPQPPPTSTPTTAPIILTGGGDSVRELAKWDGPALAHITYTGTDNFAVWNYGADGEKIDLLVNVIGNYEGTRPIDFLDTEQTVRFQIQAQGQWTIEVLPLTQIRHVTIPGTFEGKGDDVVFMDGNNPDLLKINASKVESNFAIWGYGDGRDLLVNEIGPYEGTVIVSRDTVILIIEAEGNWTIEVTTK